MAKPNRDDVQLNLQQVQSLSSTDQLVSFFSYLGYPAEARLQMTASALQLPEKLADAVQFAELLTEVDDGISRLQIYLFKLNSVTVARTRDLARAFRDRSGNFLLVLTDDFDQLDFVLLEREIPGLSGSGVSTRALTVIPRLLSVDRRDPGRVALRVLRRFTFTEFDTQGEPDTLAQYDKLRSAYAIAEWSEPYFNNRALFSDYYLRERLPEDPAWQAEGRNQAFRKVRNLFAQTRQTFSEQSPSDTAEKLVRSLLEILGFDIEKGTKSNYLLYPETVPNGGEERQPGAFVLAYPWNRYLDGKDTVRDPERGEKNPGAQVVGLLEAGKAPWGVVTNGKLWRLYSAKAHSRATNYYEIDLEETLAAPDPAEAFRYFYLFFRAEAFLPRERIINGEQQSLTFLDALMEESSLYARELGERLKERVFEEVFPHFAKGFIQGLGGAEALLGLPSEERESKLQEVFNGTLTFLYRLLFLLYAESRDLLPVREVRGYYQISLQRLKEEIAGKAGPLQDLVPERLEQACSDEMSEYYERLLKLFEVIDQGSSARNVPIYNGGLFITKPDPDDQSLEARDAHFLVSTKLPDCYLALGLDRIARVEDPKRGDLGFIDYKSLGVRQLGSIYEGLLEFKLQIAPEKMAVVKGKKTEEVIPYREAVVEGRKILTQGSGRQSGERIKECGEVYLINDRRERKATGSYYTPDYIVKYIVRQTVGPVLDEKLEVLRSQLYETEEKFLALVQRKKEMENVTPDEPRLLSTNFGDELLALFDIKILDPAMGSGHFLVEAVDYVTDRLVRFFDGFPFLATFFAGMRRTILEEMGRQNVTVDPERLTDVTLLKRHVLKQCIYGVDLNPMAVELAKVSLWLDCFTLGAPLSFLDHHLRWGNSLIGAMARELDEGANNQSPQMTFLTGPFVGLLRAAESMRGVSRNTDVTMDEVRESGQLFKEFDKNAKPFKQLMDIFVARNFGVERASEFLDVFSQNQAMQILEGKAAVPDIYMDILHQARALFEEKRFFHWDLEFPEVFIDLEKTAWKQNRGFDAVVGNPPWASLKGKFRVYGIDDNDFKFFSKMFPENSYMPNLFEYFVSKSIQLIRKNGWHSFIVPDRLGFNESLEYLRRRILEQYELRKLLYKVEFPNVIADTLIYVLTRTSNGNNVVNVAVHGKTDILLDQNFYLDLPDCVWLYFDNQMIVNILEKIDSSHSINLQKIVQTTSGFGGKSSLLTSTRESKKQIPVYKGENIHRFSVSGCYYFEFRDENITGRTTDTNKLGANPKILLRKTGSRIIAAYDESGDFPEQSVYFLFDKYSRLDWLYLLSILNSEIISFYYWNKLVTNRDSTPQLKKIHLDTFPIRRIFFSTPVNKRKRLTENLINYYKNQKYSSLLMEVEVLLPKDEKGEFLAFKTNSIGNEENSDVIHDLLTFLSKKIISLNEVKQALVNAFWVDMNAITTPSNFDVIRDKGKWEKSLAKDINCRPFVDPGSHSTRTLDESLGWNEDCFEAFTGMLIGKSSITPKFMKVYRKHHSAYKTLLEQIETTDTLIDQIVYRLYGLTEEEIAVVEGK